MPRAGLTPDRLTVVAADLADADGLEQVTVSRVARAVGVQPASLYAHVDGTEDLRVRVALLALDEMADEVADALAGRAGRDALQALADAYRDYAGRHPGRYAASRVPMDDATAAASAGPRHARMTAGALRGYGMPEVEHPHAVRFLGATIHGFVHLETSGSFSHSDPDAEASWQRTIEALDVALRGWPTR